MLHPYEKNAIDFVKPVDGVLTMYDIMYIRPNDKHCQNFRTKARSRNGRPGLITRVQN